MRTFETGHRPGKTSRGMRYMGSKVVTQQIHRKGLVVAARRRRKQRMALIQAGKAFQRAGAAMAEAASKIAMNFALNKLPSGGVATGPTLDIDPDRVVEHIIPLKRLEALNSLPDRNGLSLSRPRPLAIGIYRCCTGSTGRASYFLHWNGMHWVDANGSRVVDVTSWGAIGR